MKKEDISEEIEAESTAEAEKTAEQAKSDEENAREDFVERTSDAIGGIIFTFLCMVIYFGLALYLNVFEGTMVPTVIVMDSLKLSFIVGWTIVEFYKYKMYKEKKKLWIAIALSVLSALSVSSLIIDWVNL